MCVGKSLSLKFKLRHCQDCESWTQTSILTLPNVAVFFTHPCALVGKVATAKSSVIERQYLPMHGSGSPMSIRTRNQGRNECFSFPDETMGRRMHPHMIVEAVWHAAGFQRVPLAEGLARKDLPERAMSSVSCIVMYGGGGHHVNGDHGGGLRRNRGCFELPECNCGSRRINDTQQVQRVMLSAESEQSSILT